MRLALTWLFIAIETNNLLLGLRLPNTEFKFLFVNICVTWAKNSTFYFRQNTSKTNYSLNYIICHLITIIFNDLVFI